MIKKNKGPAAVLKGDRKAPELGSKWYCCQDGCGQKVDYKDQANHSEMHRKNWESQFKKGKVPHKWNPVMYECLREDGLIINRRTV